MLRLLLFISVLSSVLFNCIAQDATIHKQIVEYRIASNYQVNVSKHYHVTIHNKDGQSYRQYWDYYDKFKKIKSMDLVLYDRWGKKVKKYNKNDAHDFSYNASNEMSDNRYLLLDPEYAAYPFSVELTSNTVQKGFIVLPEWMPRNRFGLEVEKSILKIFISNDIKLRAKEFNGIEGKVEKLTDKKGDWTVYTYEVNDLEAVNNDMSYREFYDQQARVMFSPYKFSYDNYDGSMATWESFGDWYYKLNDDRNELTEETKSYIDGLDKSDTVAFIRTLYKYMQNKTRYISIQLGIGGFQTFPANNVDTKGYGDCKALTNYMKSMLDYANVESNFLLVLAGRDERDIEKSFPSSQFNHVFLGIPNSSDTIFLECTSQKWPFNYLGSHTDDRYVLWVADENKSKIIRTPIYDETVNQLIIDSKAIPS